MIFNNADNLMLGSSEVDKVYLGLAVVWERGGDIPQEVLTQIAYLHEHYMSDIPLEDIGFIYGLYWATSDAPHYATLLLYPKTTTPRLTCGNYTNNYMGLNNKSSYTKKVFCNQSTVGSYNFPDNYNFDSTQLSTMWRTWSPYGGWGSYEPELYGNFDSVSIDDYKFNATYTAI